MVAIIFVKHCYSITFAHKLLIIQNILQLILCNLRINDKFQHSVIQIALCSSWDISKVALSLSVCIYYRFLFSLVDYSSLLTAEIFTRDGYLLIVWDLIVCLDNCVKKGRLATLIVSYHETVEYKTAILVALSQYVPSFDHDGCDNVFHLTSDVACVDKEFVSTFWLFVKSFLPEADPKFQWEACVELGFEFGIEGEAFVLTAGCEDFFDSLLV
jgi:hypothetical protein